MVLKRIETVFTNLIFWTLWPNWLNLFGHFKLHSVDDWKKPGKNQVQSSQMVPAESLKKGASRRLFFFHSLLYPLLCSQW